MSSLWMPCLRRTAQNAELKSSNRANAKILLVVPNAGSARIQGFAVCPVADKSSRPDVLVLGALLAALGNENIIGPLFFRSRRKRGANEFNRQIINLPCASGGFICYVPAASLIPNGILDYSAGRR